MKHKDDLSIHLISIAGVLRHWELMMKVALQRTSITKRIGGLRKMCASVMLSKQQICKRFDGIDEALKGLVLMNPNVIVLRSENIIIRKDHSEMKGKVKILSGGCSANEPVHSGFVGPGMLTAAVLGDSYSAPPSSTILQAIRELGQDHLEGVLLIVKNYPEDCLSFGVAMERASNEGLYVKLLLVGDDLTISKSEGRKTKGGGAGIVFIQKIAGAMSEMGCSLDNILTFCKNIVENDLTSICFGSKNSSKSPVSEDPIQKEDMEICPSNSAEINFQNQTCNSDWNVVVQTMLEFALHKNEGNQLCFDENIPIIILINNLGGQTKFEEYKFALAILNMLQEEGYDVVRTYSGSFFTHLLMPGFSVSLLKVSSPDILNYIDAPTSVPIWPQIVPDSRSENNLYNNTSANLASCSVQKQKEARDESSQYIISERSALAIHHLLNFVANVLLACESQLNLYDSQTGGDKDCGTNLSRGAQAIKQAVLMDGLQPYNLNDFFKSLSILLEVSMGGMQGLLYGLFFQAASKSNKIDIFTWFEALKSGTYAIMRYGLCSDGGGNLLDPLRAATDTFNARLTNCSSEDVVSILEDIAMSAENEAALTSKMRSTHKPDPGAHAVALWLRAIYEGYKLLF